MGIKLIITIVIVLTINGDVQGSLADGSCSFTSQQDMCGYTLSTRWNIHQGKYIFHHRVTLIKGGIGDNYFAFFDSETPFEHLNKNNSIHSEPRNTSYDMTSPVISPGNYRLSFWYTLPAYQSALDIILASTNDSTETLVWSGHGNNDDWNQTSIYINSNTTFQIVFRGHRWAYGQFIGLDNIRLQDKDQIKTTMIEPTASFIARSTSQATNTLSKKTLLFSSAEHSNIVKYTSVETPRDSSNTELRSSLYAQHSSFTPSMFLTSSFLSTPQLHSSFTSASFSPTFHQQESLSSKHIVTPTRYLTPTQSSVTPTNTQYIQVQSSSISFPPSSSMPFVMTSMPNLNTYTNSPSPVRYRQSSSDQINNSSVSFPPSSSRLAVVNSRPNPTINTKSSSPVTYRQTSSVQVQSSSVSSPSPNSRLVVVTSRPNPTIFDSSPSTVTYRQTSSVQVQSSSVSYPSTSSRLSVVTSRPDPAIYASSPSHATLRHNSSIQVQSSSVYFPLSSSMIPLVTSKPNLFPVNSFSHSTYAILSPSIPQRHVSSIRVKTSSVSFPSSSDRPYVMPSRQQITIPSFSFGPLSYTKSSFYSSTSKPYTEIATSRLSPQVPFSMLSQTASLKMPMTGLYTTSLSPSHITNTQFYKLTPDLRSKSSILSSTYSSDNVVLTSQVSPSTLGYPSTPSVVLIPETTPYTHVQATSVELFSSTAYSHYSSVVSTGKAPTLEDFIHIGCTTSNWNITIDMTGLRRLYPNASRDNIFFGDNACKGTELGAYLVFQQGLRECLTSERVASDKLMYANDLFYVIFDADQPIIRQHDWTYSLECDIGRNEVVSQHVHHDVQSHHATIATDYDVKLAFYSDPNFNNIISGPQLHAKIGDNIFVKVYTTTADWTIKMHVHTCFTKPGGSSSNQTNFYLIKDGCEMDRNTHIISQSTHETRFVFQDFEFPQNHEGLDIYCNATFCKSMDYSPKCLQVCNPMPGS